MLSLQTTLERRTWRVLRATSYAHGLPFDSNQTRQQACQRLSAALRDRRTLRRALRGLDAESCRALVALQAAGGTLPVTEFCAAFGRLTPYRPWQPESPRHPWHYPATPTDRLWFLGFIDILPQTPGSPRRIYAPPEVLALLPPLPQPRRADVPAGFVPTHPRDRLLRDMAALLGYLLRHAPRVLHGRWLAPRHLHSVSAWLSCPDALPAARSELQTGRLRFLHYLAEAAGLISAESGQLLPTVTAWRWLALPPAEACAELLAAIPADLARRTPLWRRYRLPETSARLWAATVAQLNALPAGVSVDLSSLIAAAAPHLPAVRDLPARIPGLICGPLRWLGLVKLRPSAVVALPPDHGAAESAQLRIEPGALLISLPAMPPLAPLVRVLTWADRQDASLRIDYQAVARAAGAGESAAAVINTLGALCGTLPGRAAGKIHAWVRAAGEMRLRHMTVLETDDPTRMARLRADWRLRPLFGELLSPRHVTVRPEQARQLCQRLKRRGVRVTVPQPVKARETLHNAEYLWLAGRVYQALGELIALETPIPGAVLDDLSGELPTGEQEMLQESAERVISHLKDMLSGYAPPGDILQDNPEAIQAALAEALAAQQRLVMVYHSPAAGMPVVHTIEPQLMFERGGALYVEAYCWQAGATRTFRVDRILQILEGSESSMRL